MITNEHTHTKDCPDRKEAAANRKAHDTLAKQREQQLQTRAHAEWFDSGPSYPQSALDHAPRETPGNGTLGTIDQG